MLVDESFADLKIGPDDLAQAPPVELDGEAIPEGLPERFERLLADNTKVREIWESTTYPSLSEQAFALMGQLGVCGLTKGEAAAAHVALYARHNRKEDGIRKAPYALKAWKESGVRIRGNGRTLGGEAEETAPATLPAHEPLETFLSREIQAAPSLVGEGLIVEKGLHLLVGPTKKGKTLFCVQFGLTVAGGREYWLVPELPVHRSVSVLYLNLEMPEPVFEGRLQAALRQARSQGYNVGKAWANFRWLTLRARMRLDRKDGRELLVRLIRETRAKVAVVDNLGAAMAVDSNSDERMAPIFLALYDICETEGVAIVLVLHTPKELGDRDEAYWARGSSIQSDRADTILSLKPYGNEEQGIQRRVGFILRCGPEVDPVIVTRERGSLLWTAGRQKDVRARWLRELVREEKEMPYQAALEAFEAAGHGKDRIFRTTLKQLQTEVETGRNGFGGEATLKWLGN